MYNDREDKLMNVEEILHRVNLSEGMKMADFGCGSSGHFVFPASRIVGKNGKIFAVDILKNSLENIKRRSYSENIHNIETVWSNIEIFNGSKLESGSMDVVIIINALYQSRHRSSVIREAGRILKKGGSLAILEWKKISLPFGPKVDERVDKRQIIQVAQKLGLSLEEEFLSGNFHYGLIFQKL
jgi:ubiquinone/menaquinone biosynthesis C-methylase UbiE